MNARNKLSGAVLASTTALALVVACSDDAKTSAGRSSSGYQGIGSKWTADFGDDTFEITYDATADGTVDMTAKGTYVEYDNKFRKLTVTSASGDDAPSAGDVAYGLAIPGFAFFLKPLGEDAEPIVMVKAGACPSSDFTANWIIAKYQDTDATPTATTDAMGKAEFDIGSKEATITQREFSSGNLMGSNTIDLTSCSNGAQGFDDGGDGGTMYLTANGGALVNPGSGIIFASPQLDDEATSADWNGTYSGLVFSESAGSDNVFPAKIVLSGTTGTGAKINDVAADDTDADSVEITSLAAVNGSKGIVSGLVEVGGSGETNPVNCVVSSVSGNDLLACNGADGNASGGVFPLFFFLGVKR